MFNWLFRGKQESKPNWDNSGGSFPNWWFLVFPGLPLAFIILLAINDWINYV